MVMERNSCSVLTELMGMNRLSPSHTTHERQRVLSQSYLQNIASIIQRERLPLDLDDHDFSMPVDVHPGNQETTEVSEEGERDNANLNTNGVNLCSTNKLEEVLSPRNQRYELFGGFDLRGGTNSSSRSDQLTFPSSSHVPSSKNLELSEAKVQHKKSFRRIKTDSVRSNILKAGVEEAPAKRFAELDKTGRKSSFSSSNALYGGGKLNNTPCVRNKGTNFQNQRVKSLCNGVESPIQGPVLPQEIAQKITNQVKQSAWHSCGELPGHGSRTDKSSTNELEEMASSSYLFQLENRLEGASLDLSAESTSFGIQRITKQSSEKWGMRKCLQEVRASSKEERQEKMSGVSTQGRKSVADWIGVNFTATSTSGKVNDQQVCAARFLSKPMLFPSAWIPGSRNRHFILDKNWCLRPGEKDGLRCNISMADNFGYKFLRSAPEPSGPTALDPDKCSFAQKAPSIPKHLGMFEEQLMLEEISTAQESFSDRSAFSSGENLAYHEVHKMLDDTEGKYYGEQGPQDDSVAPLYLECIFTPINMVSDHAAYKDNEKMANSIKLQRRLMSAEPSTCILMEDRGSEFQEFGSEQQLQLKDNAARELRSPVSSLEGPEACRLHSNLAVESEELSCVPECFENADNGLQTMVQLVEATSLESDSEGPGMMVSSDEGDEGGSVGSYWKDSQIMEIYGSSESRDFSYLADILMESGFSIPKFEMEIQSYCSSGYVLSVSVFKLLEEKYYKQTCWESSDRRLLFDRINSGLMEIAQLFVGINTWRKSVAKRFGFAQGQMTIEEQLWVALVNQEEESKKEASDKLCRRGMEWLELEEDIGLLVQEIEFSLIDELIEAFVAVDIF